MKKDRSSQIFHNNVSLLLSILAAFFLTVVSTTTISAPAETAISKSVEEASLFKAEWISVMSKKLEAQLPDSQMRLDFLNAVHDESGRAGISPQVVMSVIDVASGFKKYAVSSDGARGYMQVMPHWVKVIGKPDQNLFHLRTNLRYGCTLLRNYLDAENGSLINALSRYREQMAGAVGLTGVNVSEFPETVMNRAKSKWNYE